MDYLEHHSLLTSSQHGFVKGKSNKTAISDLTELICDQLESGELVTRIMLDFITVVGWGILTNCRHQWISPTDGESSQVVEIKHNSRGIIQHIKYNSVSK